MSITVEGRKLPRETFGETRALDDCFAFQFKYWCRIRRELEKIFSESAAQVIFHILGKSYGSGLGENILRFEPTIPPTEAFVRLGSHMQANNWGTFKVLELDLKGTFRAQVRGSFEVKKYYQSKQPSCFFLKGLFSGFLTTLAGRETLSTEIWCISQGGEACEFEVLWATPCLPMGYPSIQTKDVPKADSKPSTSLKTSP